MHVNTSAIADERPRTLSALDDLLDAPAAELERMYLAAPAPSISEVKGDLRGRMLAWPSLSKRPIAHGALRAFAGSQVFPWRGKSFAPHDEARGEGINRIVHDRFRSFRFDTFIGPSLADGAPALQLDYDLPQNPPIIRNIKDEIRTIAPGVWLGQAWFVTSRGKFLWLYFGLARTDA